MGRPARPRRLTGRGWPVAALGAASVILWRCRPVGPKVIDSWRSRAIYVSVYRWTHWVGTTTPGGGEYNPGRGNAPNLNAGIPGGAAGSYGAQPGAHGLCGGSVSTAPGKSATDSSFMAVTNPR